MSRDRVKSCLVCAWRANCTKRFTIGDDATLHCPDFSRDVLLDKQVDNKTNDDEREESS